MVRRSSRGNAVVARRTPRRSPGGFACGAKVGSNLAKGISDALELGDKLYADPRTRSWAAPAAIGMSVLEIIRAAIDIDRCAGSGR